MCVCGWGGGGREGERSGGGGNPKVHYFMINPWAPSRLFPKMNTINFNKVGLIVCEGDCVCVGRGEAGGEGSGGGAAPRCTTL